MADTTYSPLVYKKQGGDEQVVASGGVVTVESGGIVNIASGGHLQNAGVNLDLSAGIATSTTSSTAELNLLTGCTATAAEIIQGCDSSVNTEIVTATNVILAAESGATFFLNSATEFVSTLPAISGSKGLRFRFIVSAAPSGASYTVICASAGTLIKGHVLCSQDAGGTADSGTAGELTLTFVDGKAVAGDWAEFISDGTNWFVQAGCKVFDAITIS